jgi:hypothetical protein
MREEKSATRNVSATPQREGQQPTTKEKAASCINNLVVIILRMLTIYVM